MTTLASSRGIRGRWSAERAFHVGMSVAIAAAVLLGFARTYYLRPLFPGFPSPAETFFYGLHGVTLTAWFALLVTQSLLIANGRPQVHRHLGKAGVVLAAAVIVFSAYGALVAAGRPGGFVGIPVPGPAFLAIPVFDLLLFGSFVALAVANRNEAASHKRLMLLAAIALLPASAARWPGLLELGNPLAFFTAAYLFVVPIAVRDFRTRGRLHPVTLWGGLALVLSVPLRLSLSTTAAWDRFAHWAIGWVY